MESDRLNCFAVAVMLALFSMRHARTAEASPLVGLPRLSLPLCVLPVAAREALATSLPLLVRSLMRSRSISAI